MYATVTLTGTYQLPNGTPAKGTIEIIPSERLIVDDAGDVILSGRVKIQLDEAGQFSVDLPATDDPSLNPTGFGYTLAARLHHTHLPAVSFSLPAAVPEVDVTDVTQVDPSTFAPDANYITDAELDAALATKQDSSGVDDSVAALVEDEGSDTTAALSATYVAFETDANGYVTLYANGVEI